MSGTGELMRGWSLVAPDLDSNSTFRVDHPAEPSAEQQTDLDGTSMTDLIQLDILVIHPLHELHDLPIGQGAHICILIDDPLGSFGVHVDDMAWIISRRDMFAGSLGR